MTTIELTPAFIFALGVLAGMLLSRLARWAGEKTYEWTHGP